MAQNVVKEIKKESKNQIKSIKQNAKNEIKNVKAKTLEILASKETKYARQLEIKKLREEQAKIPKRYSIGEEIFNSVSHGVGAGLSIAALVLLIVKAVFYAPKEEMAFYVTGFTIFGASLVILYLMSTLYHALTPYHVKKIFAIFDHSCIYFLIAGTYTPLCLGVLRDSWGWVLFGVIWGLTILGITFYALFGSKMRVFSAISYVIMGWLIVFAWKPLTKLCPAETCSFLIYGGIAYTVGCIFYALKKIKWTHCVWHLFVVAGSVLHFFSIYFSL